MLFCGGMAALLPCRLHLELGPRRMGGSQRPPRKGFLEWGTYSLPCSDPASWQLCQGEDSGKPPPLGSGSWVGPQGTKRELAGSGSAELGVSSSDQVPFLCVAAGDWLVGGREPSHHCGPFLPLLLLQDQPGSAGPLGQAPCGGGGRVGVGAWSPLPSWSLRAWCGGHQSPLPPSPKPPCVPGGSSLIHSVSCFWISLPNVSVSKL